MNLHDLALQLKKNELKSFYVFTGEEVKVMDIYISKIAATSKMEKVNPTTVASIYTKLKIKSVVSKPTMYVIRDDMDFIKHEKVWKEFISGKIQGSNSIVLLVYNKLDKRSKFYKQIKNQIVDFEKLSSTVLAKYIRKELEITNVLATELANLCQLNYSMILLECDKIRHLADAWNWKHDKATNYAMDYLIYSPPGDVVFSLVDAICKRQVNMSFHLAKEFKEAEPSCLGLLSLLYTNFKSMLIVKGIPKGTKDVTKTTGLTSFQIKLAREKGHSYKASELVKAVKKVREIEIGIKTGKVEADKALDMLLVSVL